MNVALFGIPGIPLGKRNIKDPRMDETHRLVEADKKAYAQVDVIGEDRLLDAHGILTTREAFPDLILKDLEFVETRAGRQPPPVEQAALVKIQAALESERCASTAQLSPEEQEAMAAHNLWTSRPVTVAEAAELEQPDELFVRAFREAGYISFLTVGGKENRAWAIRQGATAWEAAGAIHSDIQKGFIRAEIISYADFIETGGETQAKRAGKQRLETKAYVMHDFDLTNFRFNK
jgi:ribosome-binding ATPase YchF (GTP1/OBG family)